MLRDAGELKILFADPELATLGGHLILRQALHNVLYVLALSLQPIKLLGRPNDVVILDFNPAHIEGRASGS